MTSNFSFKRVVAHVDMDSFYAQVEHRRLGIPRDVPLAVQQWDGLIAVNYPAKALGVSRGERASVAKMKWPQLVLVHVQVIGSTDDGLQDDANPSTGGSRVCEPPNKDRHKVCLRRYRNASDEVMNILEREHPNSVERASIDEAYVDLTPAIEQKIMKIYSILLSVLLHPFPQISRLSDEHSVIDLTSPESPTSLDEPSSPPPQSHSVDPAICLFKRPPLLPPQLHQSGNLERLTVAWTAAWISYIDKVQEISLNLLTPQQPTSSSTSTDEISNKLAQELFGNETALLGAIRSGSHLLPTIFRDAFGNINTLKDCSCEDFPLLIGALIMHETRSKVLQLTELTASAGIGHSMFLAKEISAKHKPNAQTIVFEKDVNTILSTVPLRKARGLRGKAGELVSATLPGVQTLFELQQMNLEELKAAFPEPRNKFAVWLYNISRGLDYEIVRSVTQVKSMLACKAFPPHRSYFALQKWIVILCKELAERLRADYDTHKRLPKTLGREHRPRTYSCSPPSARRAGSLLQSLLIHFSSASPVLSVADLIQFTKQVLEKRIPSSDLFPCTRLGIAANNLTPAVDGLSKFLQPKKSIQAHATPDSM